MPHVLVLTPGVSARRSLDAADHGRPGQDLQGRGHDGVGAHHHASLQSGPRCRSAGSRCGHGGDRLVRRSTSTGRRSSTRRCPRRARRSRCRLAAWSLFHALSLLVGVVTRAAGRRHPHALAAAHIGHRRVDARRLAPCALYLQRAGDLSGHRHQPRRRAQPHGDPRCSSRSNGSSTPGPRASR